MREKVTKRRTGHQPRVAHQYADSLQYVSGMTEEAPSGAIDRHQAGICGGVIKALEGLR